MNRIIIEASLEPIFSTIQPAFFIDVGHSLFAQPLTNKQCLIVDSSQSVANYLEDVTWNALEQKLVDPLIGLPYIELQNQEKGTKPIASSITLPHRLGSGYFAKHNDSELKNILIEEIDRYGPYRTLFKYDPNSIIHGCFLSHLGGVATLHRISRLLTGRIEAKNVVAVSLGGTSKDPLSASGKNWDMDLFEKNAKGNKHKPSELGLGNLPYHTEEYACETISAKFIINCKSIEATGLPKEAQNLIGAIAQWKVLKFLNSPIRLRTTEYECGEITGNTLELSSLEKEIPKLIKTCTKKGYFADPVVTVVALTLRSPKQKSKSKNKATNNQQKEEEE